MTVDLSNESDESRENKRSHVELKASIEMDLNTLLRWLNDCEPVNWVACLKERITLTCGNKNCPIKEAVRAKVGKWTIA